jgi:hypothetical protein
VRQYNIPPVKTATEFSVAVFSLEVITVKVYYLSIICFVTLALAIKSTCLCSELIYQDNPNIQITCNNIEYDGSILIEGTSPNLNRVWFCVRSPQQDLSLWYADVVDQKFNVKVNLRSGPGKYTIWADDNPNRFDGRTLLTVYNQSEETRYTSASMYVDSESPEIVELSSTLAPEDLSPRKKLENIYTWITKNVAYDYDAFLADDIKTVKASQVLANKKGLCGDFAFLFAALARSSGLPAKVVYGYGCPSKTNNQWRLHAWNEVLVDGEWLHIDCSWDAGIIVHGFYYHVNSQAYLAPDPDEFNLSHRVVYDTMH